MKKLALIIALVTMVFTGNAMAEAVSDSEVLSAVQSCDTDQFQVWLNGNYQLTLEQIEAINYAQC